MSEEKKLLKILEQFRNQLSDKEIALNLSVVVKAHVENMAGFDGVPVEEWVDYRGWRDENETGYEG